MKCLVYSIFVLIAISACQPQPKLTPITVLNRAETPTSTPTQRAPFETLTRTPIVNEQTMMYGSGRDLTVHVDGRTVTIRSTAVTVGQALAGVGIPLLGLDASIPSENEPLPMDGQITIVRVVETVNINLHTLPFNSRFEASAELELDTQGIVQVGEPGLAMRRVRIHTENEQETAQFEENEGILRPPRDQVTGYGTNVVAHTAMVDGITLQYWRAVRVYTTSYSPCRSGGSRCYPGTASGKPVQKGVVAVVSRWYPSMVGLPVYIPGYGYATIEDIGAGFSDRYWVDLGWSDEDFQPMEGWNMLYFLVPIPVDILYILPYK